MKTITLFSLFFISLLSTSSIKALAERSITTDPQLHPLDTFTSDVFKKGEWSYAQPPIFAPGYSFYGLTDSITLQLDYTAWLGGVPSFNIRNKILSQSKGLNISLESMIIYMDKDLKEMDKDNQYLYIKREGTNGYFRINSSYNLSDRLTLYGSLGISYSEYLKIQNENRDVLHGQEFNFLNDPVVMIGARFIQSDTLAYYMNISYGETWLYFENRPRKTQLIYGIRWVPFKNNPKTILNTLAIDFAAVMARFDDTNEEILLPLPIFPLLTWQWH